MALVCPVYGMPCNCFYRCQPAKKPSHRHGSPRTERGETTGPKPSATAKPSHKRGEPQTYILTCEFTLRFPVDYNRVTKEIREAIDNISCRVSMQYDGPYFEKTKEVKDG